VTSSGRLNVGEINAYFGEVAAWAINPNLFYR
jgi:hypothetical protein